MSNSKRAAGVPKRKLSVFDSICIIVGIIIGSGIYKTAPLIAANTDGVMSLTAVWLLGGLIALLGALCYAELATAYPKEGGDYVYLTLALGRRTGFLFAWSDYWIIRPGNVGMLAFVFATYAQELFPLPMFPDQPQLRLIVYAAGSVLTFSALNILGVQSGKWTQNVLTVVKSAGLLAIFAAAVFLPAADSRAAAEAGMSFANFYLAMILVLFCYGGWNEMSYVAAEVHNPQKNIFLALVIGAVAVTVIYVLVNFAFVRLFGFGGFREADAVAADIFRPRMGDTVARAMSALVCISCLGSMNGLVFTGARIFYAVGTEHRIYSWLGKWNSRLDAPVRSLLMQLVVSLGLIVGFGWDKKGFEKLLIFTTPVFWSFAFLVGIALFVLRRKDRNRPATYRVQWYVPAVFCLVCLFLVHASLDYAIEHRSYEALWAIGFLAVGVVMSFFDPPIQSHKADEPA